LNEFKNKVVDYIIVEILNSKVMKVQIFSVPCTDQTALTAVQQKINQWITVGLLKKYQMHTTSSHIVFNVCLKKEA
jgi:hypothetical protein